MTLTARSPAASPSQARPATNVVPTRPSSKHTLAGSPHGEPAALTHRPGELGVRFTITAFGPAVAGTIGDRSAAGATVDARVAIARAAPSPAVTRCTWRFQ